MASKGKRRGKPPLDIKKLMSAMEDASAARELPAHVCIVMDVTASDTLINGVIDAFATPSETTTLTHLILGSEPPELPTSCDLCVIVGGQSLSLGQLTAKAEENGYPAVVVIEEGETFFVETADEASEILQDEACNEQVGISLGDIVCVDFKDEYPLEELGRWIISRLPNLKASLAADFPFLRCPLATALTEQVALQNAGIGLLVVVPGADMPAITLNQARMVLQIASVYGQSMDYSRVAEIAAVVAGAFGFRALARELSGALPVVGWGVKGIVAYTGTLAMGRAAVEYFEEGGRISTLATAISQAAEAASASIAEAVTAVTEQVEKDAQDPLWESVE